MFQAFYRAIHNIATTSTATATYCATTVATAGPAACTVAERHKGTRCPLSQWKAWQQNGWTIWCIFTDSVYLRVSVFFSFFLVVKNSLFQYSSNSAQSSGGSEGVSRDTRPVRSNFFHFYTVFGNKNSQNNRLARLSRRSWIRHCNAVNMFSYVRFFLGCFCLVFPSSFTLISLLVGSPLCHAQVTYVQLPCKTLYDSGHELVNMFGYVRRFSLSVCLSK